MMAHKIISIEPGENTSGEGPELVSTTYRFGENDVFSRGTSVLVREPFIFRSATISDYEPTDFNLDQGAYEAQKLALHLELDEVSKSMADKNPVASEFFGMLSMIVNDDTYLGYEKLQKVMEKEKGSLADAIVFQFLQIKSVFDAMPDTRFAARWEDIEDAAIALLRKLGVPGFQEDLKALLRKFKSQTVGVITDRLPNDAANMLGRFIDTDHTTVNLVLLSENARMGKTSHPALVARSAGVPMIRVPGLILDAVKDAAMVGVNFQTQEVIFNPTEEQAQIIAGAQRQESAARREKQAILQKLPNQTADGQVFEFAVNLDQMNALSQMLDVGLLGSESRIYVGLVRTELVYGGGKNNQDFLADPDRQSSFFYQLYKNIDNDVRVIIRVLDQDARDKRVGGLQGEGRGFDLIRENEAIFINQIRGIIEGAIKVGRTSADILFPMTNTPEDVQYARTLVLRARVLAKAEAFEVRVGGMIESLPALECDDLGADFYSYGVNDLKDDLGEDRGDDYILYNPLEFLAIEWSMKRLKEQGKFFEVCGGLASEPFWAYAFMANGGVPSSDFGSAPDVKSLLVQSHQDQYEAIKIRIIQTSTYTKRLLGLVARRLNVRLSNLIKDPSILLKFFKQIRTIKEDDPEFFARYQSTLQKASSEISTVLSEIEAEWSESSD